MYQVVKGGLLEEVTSRVQLDICYDTTAKKECKFLVESTEQNVQVNYYLCQLFLLTSIGGFLQNVYQIHFVSLYPFFCFFCV